MTITLKSNPDGVSGAIQVNGVDRLTVNSSGAVTASTNPATGLRSTALATMQKFADEFGSSLAASGYQKLPSGLIIQWGGATTNSSGDITFTHPITFPGTQYFGIGIVVGYGNFAVTATGYGISSSTYRGNGLGAGASINILVIGK